MKHLTFIQQAHGALDENDLSPHEWEIRALHTVDSTNNRVDKMLGLYDKVIVLSRAQSSGRGRQEKIWYSPVGGMWLSIGFMADTEVIELSTPVIEAVNDVLVKYVDGEIKEPNDILIDSMKICGILVETKIKHNRLRRIIIGIGINVSNEIPDEISDVATRLVDHGSKPAIEDLATDVSISVIDRLRDIIPNSGS